MLQFEYNWSSRSSTVRIKFRYPYICDSATWNTFIYRLNKVFSWRYALVDPDPQSTEEGWEIGGSKEQTILVTVTKMNAIIQM